MFKKGAFKVASDNLLSGKDKKKLKSDLAKSYHLPSVEHFFDKTENLWCQKLSGSKILIYKTDSFPALVDPTGKGDYFPTLYLAAAYPSLVMTLDINEGVESFIFNGANLMWPGVKKPELLKPFKKDDVAIIKNPAGKPIAMGAMACSSDDLQTSGPMGTAAYVLTYLEDKLWEMGPKTLPTVALEEKQEKPEDAQGAVDKDDIFQPTAEEKKAFEEKKEEKKGAKKGKQEDSKKESSTKAELKKEESKSIAPTKASEKQPSEDEDEEEQNEDDEKAQLESYFANITKAKASQKKPLPQAKEIKKAGKGVFEDDDDEKKVKGKGKGKGKKGPEPTKDGGKKKANEENEDEEEEEQKEEEKEPAIPMKVMDEYIMEAFLTALKISINDRDLPIDSSAFYSNHMMRCARENISLDFKNSSWKKLAKFYQAMDKIGFIGYQDSKKGTNSQIVRVNRSNKELQDFEPLISKPLERETSREEKKESDEFHVKIDVVELCKPKVSVYPIFRAGEEGKLLEITKDMTWTLKEAHDFLNKFLRRKSEKKSIVVDDQMKSIFPNIRDIKDEESDNEEDSKMPPEEGAEVKKKVKTQKGEHVDMVPREHVIKLFDKELEHFHKIIDLEKKKEVVKPGAFKGLKIVAEKSHNKNITRISGLEAFGLDHNALSTKFQVMFACAVSTHDNPGKGAGKDLIVHGNFLTELVDFFSNECKIDKRFIDSLNKMEKKKKKGPMMMGH